MTFGEVARRLAELEKDLEDLQKRVAKEAARTNLLRSLAELELIIEEDTW